MNRNYLALVAMMSCALLLWSPAPSWAQVAPTLGVAEAFGVLANSGVTGSADGGVVVNGDVGSSPTPTINNFPPSRTVPPFNVHFTDDGVVQQAHIDSIAAYTFLQGQVSGEVLPDNLATVGELTSGIYSFVSGAPDLPAGTTLTLNGGGVFIFNVGSSLTANINSVVAGTADPCNIYWRVGSSATLNGNNFRGTVIANTSITLGDGANMEGRLLAGTGDSGAVTMAGAGGNTIGGCSDAAALPTPPPTPPPTPLPTPLPAICPTGNVAPVVTVIPDQLIPVSGTTTLGFTATGAVIPEALVVTATNDNPTLIPTSAVQFGPPNAAGVRTLTISGADGRSGNATITVTVTDPVNECATPMAFLVTVGAVPVPTLSEWAMIGLTILLALTGFFALRRRETHVAPQG